MANKRIGICALTGRKGKFVKCHIIPKALTPKEFPGGPLMQTDGIGRHKRRFDSWYDPDLVIRLGENFFSTIDDRAIKILRNQKLTWDSWDNPKQLNMQEFTYGACSGLRWLPELDQTSIAKFVVSVVWRAGASRISDMQNFKVSKRTLEKAKDICLDEKEFDPEEFPIRMMQFATKGPFHNLTPMNQEMTFPSGVSHKFFRIYANGVFFHVFDTSDDNNFNLGAAKYFLGNTDNLAVLCFDYEKSSQAEFASNIAARYFNASVDGLDHPFHPGN